MVRVPILTIVSVLTNKQKVLVELNLCGGESYKTWKRCLDNLVVRGLKTPLLYIIDNHTSLRRAISEI